MLINGKYTLAKIKIINNNTPRMSFKPSIEVSSGSAAKVYSGSRLTTTSWGKN